MQFSCAGLMRRSLALVSCASLLLRSLEQVSCARRALAGLMLPLGTACARETNPQNGLLMSLQKMLPTVYMHA
jgi:hypothetical protein